MTLKKNPNINIFAPIIKLKNEKIFSPVDMRGLFFKGAKLKPGIHSLSSFSPVNSGVLISLKLFQKVEGYNENVFLDYADFCFFEKVSLIENKFFLMDLTAIQDFSNEERDFKKLYQRYKISLVSIENCHWNSSIKSFKVYLNILKHTIALSLRTFKFNFLILFLKNIWGGKIKS